MNKEELVNRLIEYRNKNPKGNTNTIKDKILLQALLDYPEFIDRPINEKAAALVLGLNEIPKCECGNPVEFLGKFKDISPFGGWRDYCSRICMQTSKNTVEKRKSTLIERTGYDSYAKTPEGRAKASELWSDEKKAKFNAASKKTNLEKRGVEHHSQTQEYLDKRAKTILEQTDGKFTNYFQDVERVQNGVLKKYGVKSWKQTEEGKEVSRGENNPMHSIETKLKAQLTKKSKKYDEILLNIIINNDAKSFKEYIDTIAIKNGYEFRQQIANHLNLSNSFLNNLFRQFNMSNEYISLGTSKSYEEQTLYDFIVSIYDGDIVRGSRSLLGNGQEIDIYLPELKIGFEYDSPYTHSELKGKDQLYHVIKTDLAEERGIHLFHIFGNEWTVKEKRIIWESIISSKLGLVNNKIHARKCSIKEITSKEAKDFFDINHLSGGIYAKYNLGLMFEDKLVSVLSYGNSRFSKDEMEIYRFATKLNTIVIGAFGKLLSQIPYNNLISFADRRIAGINTVYDQFFTTKVKTEPNWFIFKIGLYNDLKHRMSFTKDKVKQLIEHYDDSLTIIENLFNNGYDRIFDCGNWKYSNRV